MRYFVLKIPFFDTKIKVNFFMKRLALLAVLLFVQGSILAQSLSVTGSASESSANTAEINQDGLTVMESGQAVMNGSYSLPTQKDPSLKAFALPNGAAVVRENIANFLLYDSFGTVKNSISDSTQSEGGEAISELAMDPAGKTIVVYNPKVIVGGKTGSRAKKIDYRNMPVDVFYSADRELKSVQVSSNGEFVAFISAKTGTEDQVQLADRFGNDLNSISFDQEIKGVTFSENGLFVTIYSGARAAAYEVRNGDRVGSTSFRTSVKFAAYSPEDKTIVALTGEGESSITELQFHAINVAARKIAREEYAGSVTKVQRPEFVRDGKGSYRIKGFSKEFVLDAAF